ncbi:MULTISPECIES: hypothetical protein [unclassified Nocardia]|uniref:hypothetical protein n=1 Tax=unclassified Nocardia TaxID=2637762 RepID=UPI0024A8EE9A|nr:MULTISPECIES: hypothetical protein [unclassified Nocardia]
MTPDHLYLSHDAIRELDRLLREIPDLSDDLADAFACRTRLNGPTEYRLQPRSATQPLPYNPAASKAADHLHAVLSSWTRLICEQRGLPYTAGTTTPALARWLHRNLIAFAMTEGVESAPAELAAAVATATRIVCPPARDRSIDDAQLAQARRTRLSASGIATLAKELSGDYQGLTVRRVRTLRDAGRIDPVPGPWSPDLPEMFVVGEVLDAHLAYPARRSVAA